MISFLASPKPFIGTAEINQMRAIRSWLAIDNEIEVILYGDSPGTAAVCRDLGIRHVPEIQASERGIPYFGAIAEHATEHALYDLQVYVNCDILLTPQFLEAIQQIPFASFLMIGQRIDLAEDVEIDPGDPQIFIQLDALAKAKRTTLHPPAGSDYFGFKRGMWNGLPPVIIGRGGYDNALIAYCLQRRIPVIDATQSVLALHQHHDYGHVKNGIDEIFLGEEAFRNNSLYADPLVSLTDSDWCLTKDLQLKRNYARGERLKFTEMFLRYKLRKPSLAKIINLFRRM